MKITVLGSSHGAPEPNRRCSSTMIEVNGNLYFIDMGCNILEDFATRGIAPEKVHSVFITHMHYDHTNGLLPLLGNYHTHSKTADPEIFIPGDKDLVANGIKAWLNCNLEEELRDFRYFSVHEGLFYSNEDIKVTAFSSTHRKNAYSYLVEAEGKRVYFSGDYSIKVKPESKTGPQLDFPREILNEPLDLAFCEGAHFSSLEYVDLFKGQTNLKKLCINHYSLQWLNTVLELKSKIETPVILATDNLEFNL